MVVLENVSLNSSHLLSPTRESKASRKEICFESDVVPCEDVCVGVLFASLTTSFYRPIAGYWMGGDDHKVHQR